MRFTNEEVRELCFRHIPFDKWIPKEDLIIGVEYLCKARNFYLGTWNGKSFDYLRYKFGAYFNDIEYHWDNGAPYGTVKPLQSL